MTDPASYEKLWPTWLGDACYRFALGTRYLDIPSEVSVSTWGNAIKPSLVNGRHNGVLVRYAGDCVCGEIQIAMHSWVFDVFDRAMEQEPRIKDAMIGVLLGYNSDKIARFLDGRDYKP